MRQKYYSWTWREIFETSCAALAFYLSGVLVSSDVFDRQNLGWKVLIILAVVVAMQSAHWLFEDTYRRKYQSPPKHVLVRVKSEHGDIERIITPRQNEAYAIRIYDKTVSIELKEDKK